MRMDFDRFTEEAIVLFRPSEIPNWQSRTRPVRGRFLSAHFFFTIGDFVKEVPYDPDLYFVGEEISLTVRAFTHGYDLFHPPEIIVWHEYTRQYRTKHWDDHVKTRGIEREWHQRDAASKEKVKRFLADPHVGEFGCGTARTFAEYEAYAGLSFRHRRVQEYTRLAEEPPNPAAPPDWAERISAHCVRIDLEENGLLGTFFQALREGDVERLLLRPPRGASPGGRRCPRESSPRIRRARRRARRRSSVSR